MTERIDIRDETAAICAKLGLDPSDVAALAWTPSVMTATVYLHNEEGAKYVDPATNSPAQEQQTFKVRT